MNKTFFAAIMMATLPIACSAPSSDTAETTETVEAAIAEVSDGMEFPVFTGPAGSENVAVSGFDTVSYFEGDGVPVEGSKDHRVKYNGVEYHFASAENAEKFQAEPAKYAPQYGGYCAWAIGANDALAPGDAQVYEIVDGKLYLNFNKQVQENWQKDIPGFIEKADTNYPAHSADEHYQD